MASNSTIRANNGLGFQTKRYASPVVSAVSSLLENIITVRSADVRRHCGLAIEEHVARIAGENREMMDKLSLQERRIEELSRLSLDVHAGQLRERDLSNEVATCREEIRNLKRKNNELVDEVEHLNTSRKDSKRVDEEISTIRDKLQYSTERLEEVVEAKNQLEFK